MKNLTLYLTTLLCFFLSNIFAQEKFEDKARAIADKIESITKDEKAALQLEVESVNTQLENGAITKEQADEKKLLLAESRAKSIETRVAEQELELKNLVQQKVDGNIEANGKKNQVGITWQKDKNKKEDENGEQRTTSQGVLAFGFNNLVTDGAVANSDFGYLRSMFFEWGATNNTRILKESNLLHFKYGVSFMYNCLNATENRSFVDVYDPAGNRTELQTFGRGLRAKDTYFKNVFVTVPMHLEFDFSKTETKEDGTRIFRSHKGLRLGLGGFVGYNINSKQFLSYRVDGYRINERQKGNWNIEDWNYGVSAYLGYKETSIYVKYDLNPMFKNNTIDQNNISLGLRFDFN